MIVLHISLDGTFLRPFLLIIFIDIAHLEEAQVLCLAVHITDNALQTAEEKRLAHYAQVSRQGIHYLYRLLPGIGIEFCFLIIGTLGEGVVHDFREALAHQLLADDVLPMVVPVGFFRNRER